MGAKTPTWFTPNEVMQNTKLMNEKLEKTKLPLPEVPEQEMTFFNNEPAEATLLGYDQFFSYTRTKPLFDPRKNKDNRHYMPCVWENIFQQEIQKPIALTTAKMYGRPCRLFYDFRQFQYNRASQTNEFYRKKGFVIPPIETELQ